VLKRHLRTISMEIIHVFQVTCQQKQVSHVSNTWARANKTFEFLSSTSGNKKRKSVCWRDTYVLFRWKQSIDSKSNANKHKLVTFLIHEVRERDMGWCTHVSVDKRDISFSIFSPTEAKKVPTQRTPTSKQNQIVSIKKTKISISPRWARANKSAGKQDFCLRVIKSGN